MNDEKRGFRTIIASCILLFVMIGPVQAQDVFNPSVGWMNTDDPRYSENVIARHWEQIEQDQFADVFEALAESAMESATDWSGAEEVQERLISALEAAAEEISDVDSEFNGVYIRHLDKINTGRFAEGTAGQGFVAFNGMSPPIVLCMDGAEMAPPCNEAMHPVLTQGQAEDIRYRANTANELMMILRAEADDAILEAIETSYKRWVNFLDNGFVMYPWEIGLNSALLNWDIRTPPSTQFIFLHPSLGVQIPLDGFTDPVEFRAKESLVIEVAGHLWYRGEYLDNFSGISGTVVLREDLPPGFGFLLRPRRGFSAGLNWHLSASEQKEFIKTPFLTVSVDLFQIISSNRGKLEFLTN